MKLKWVGNGYDPAAPDAFEGVTAGATRPDLKQAAWESWQKWLAKVQLGDPFPYHEGETKEGLEAQGLVGAYIEIR